MNKFLAIFLLLCIVCVIKAQIHISPDSVGNKTASENIYIKNIAHDSLSSGFIIIIKKEVKLHKHLLHSEYIAVIEGEGTMKVGNQEFFLKKNDIVFIPKNTPHSVITTSKVPLKVMSIQAPFFDGKDRVLISN